MAVPIPAAQTVAPANNSSYNSSTKSQMLKSAQLPHSPRTLNPHPHLDEFSASRGDMTIVRPSKEQGEVYEAWQVPFSLWLFQKLVGWLPNRLLTLFPPAFSVLLQRYLPPGYQGHVQTKVFQFGKSFGRVSRDVLNFHDPQHPTDPHYKELF